jgi:hypothetical protein
MFEAAKVLGAGLATISIAGTGDGIGVIFSYFFIFAILLILQYIYFSKQLDKWVSSYNLIIYKKKKLLFPFLRFYIFNLSGFILILYNLFFPIIHNFSFSLKLFLGIFMINIITLGLMCIISLKCLKKQYNIVSYKNVSEYQNEFFQEANKQKKIIENSLNIEKNLLKRILLEKQLEEINIYNQAYKDSNKDDNTSFFNLQQQVNILQKLYVRWLQFYNFLLNFFLIIILFIYFYYFDITFQVANYNISSLYIFMCLFIISLIRFFQNYLILFKSTNTANNEKLACFNFYKQEQKYFFFGIPENYHKLQFLVKYPMLIFLTLITILINCKILILIFKKIYFKKNLFLLELIFNIPFGPIMNNFEIPQASIFYNYFILFIGLIFFLLLLFFSLNMISFYFYILCDIYTTKLAPVFLKLNYTSENLMTEEHEKINETDLEKFKNNEFTYKDFANTYTYDILWFKNLKSFLKENFQKHKILSFNFIKYNFYLFIGSIFGLIIILGIIVLFYYYYKIIMNLHWKHISMPILFFTKNKNPSIFDKLKSFFYNYIYPIKFKYQNSLNEYKAQPQYKPTNYLLERTSLTNSKTKQSWIMFKNFTLELEGGKPDTESISIYQDLFKHERQQHNDGVYFYFKIKNILDDVTTDDLIKSLQTLPKSDQLTYLSDPKTCEYFINRFKNLNSQKQAQIFPYIYKDLRVDFFLSLTEKQKKNLIIYLEPKFVNKDMKEIFGSVTKIDAFNTTYKTCSEKINFFLRQTNEKDVVLLFKHADPLMRCELYKYITNNNKPYLLKYLPDQTRKEEFDKLPNHQKLTYIQAITPKGEKSLLQMTNYKNNQLTGLFGQKQIFSNQLKNNIIKPSGDTGSSETLQ